MTRQRTLISILLGLALLLQGFAVSAAPATPPAQADMAAMEGMAGMPCHEDDMAAQATPASCCDHACPDMAACMLGAAFAATPVMALAFPPFANEIVSLREVRPSAGLPVLRLRPPIDLHS